MERRNLGSPSPDGDDILDKIQAAAERMSQGTHQKQAAQKVQERELEREAAVSRSGSPSPRVTLVAWLVFIGATLANLTGNGFFKTEPPPPTEAVYWKYLNYKVEEIRSLAEEQGRPPEHLSEIDPQGEGGWEYVRRGKNGFRLTLIEKEFQLVWEEEDVQIASTETEETDATH